MRTGEAPTRRTNAKALSENGIGERRNKEAA